MGNDEGTVIEDENGDDIDENAGTGTGMGRTQDDGIDAIGTRESSKNGIKHQHTKHGGGPSNDEWVVIEGRGSNRGSGIGSKEDETVDDTDENAGTGSGSGRTLDDGIDDTGTRESTKNGIKHQHTKHGGDGENDEWLVIESRGSNSGSGSGAKDNEALDDREARSSS